MTEKEKLLQNAKAVLAAQCAVLRSDGRYDLRHYVAEITDEVERVPGLPPALKIRYTAKESTSK